jgi:c-di-GMP-binding flagellar brake protein YcgR
MINKNKNKNKDTDTDTDTDTDKFSITHFENCARLLAFSLAQHRENDKQVPLEYALPYALKDGIKAKDEQIAKEGEKLFKQALAMVESGLITVKMPTVMDEQRTQPRINVSSPVQIKVPSSGQKYKGNLLNISWGGVRIQTKELLGDMDEIVEISLPNYDGKNINILASIVRTWGTEGMYNTALRFSTIHQKDEFRLDNLLKLLLNVEDNKHRRDFRFAQRIDVSYWDPEELKATLKDISKGGMMITLPEPVELDKSIQLQLEGTDEGYSLILRARVVRVENVQISGYDLYQMALQFEHPTEELRSMINALMESMLSQGKDK